MPQVWKVCTESSRSIEDSAVGADEGLPLNGSISLFQLPSSVRTLSFQKTEAEQEAAANRETLVNSAWQERVYERLWDTPVRSCPPLLINAYC
jgi:hypothetical protein